jgi:hypothetical protein
MPISKFMLQKQAKNKLMNTYEATGDPLYFERSWTLRGVKGYYGRVTVLGYSCPAALSKRTSTLTPCWKDQLSTLFSGIPIVILASCPTFMVAPDPKLRCCLLLRPLFQHSLSQYLYSNLFHYHILRILMLSLVSRKAAKKLGINYKIIGCYSFLRFWINCCMVFSFLRGFGL